MASKSENTAGSAKKANKMVKPVKAVRPFNFPAYGITVMAESPSDAQDKLAKSLKSKSKDHD